MTVFSLNSQQAASSQSQSNIRKSQGIKTQEQRASERDETRRAETSEGGEREVERARSNNSRWLLEHQQRNRTKQNENKTKIHAPSPDHRARMRKNVTTGLSKYSHARAKLPLRENLVRRAIPVTLLNHHGSENRGLGITGGDAAGGGARGEALLQALTSVTDSPTRSSEGIYVGRMAVFSRSKTSA